MLGTTYETTTGAALSGYASAPTTASHGFAVPGNAVEVAYLVHVNLMRLPLSPTTMTARAGRRAHRQR
jgi:hypothetical protein